jgi:SAM-dependent methyltransferase
MTHYSDPGREPHEAREVAESFWSDPDRYARARPGYPDAMVKRIVDAVAGRKIVDVGCGTGIAARQFQAVGCRMLGVEPDDRMAALARQSGLEVEVATFENWDPAGRMFDAVIAAQAWHWVDPVTGAAKAAQVLCPGGRFAAFWNAFEPPRDLGEAFGDAYRRVETGLPFNPWVGSALDGYLAMCDKAAEGLGQSGSFEEPEKWRFDWDRRYSRDEWLDQVPTFGGHGQFPPSKLQELLAGIGEAIDAAGGSFTVGYATVVITAARAAVSQGRRCLPRRVSTHLEHVPIPHLSTNLAVQGLWQLSGP